LNNTLDNEHTQTYQVEPNGENKHGLIESLQTCTQHQTFRDQHNNKLSRICLDTRNSAHRLCSKTLPNLFF